MFAKTNFGRLQTGATAGRKLFYRRTHERVGIIHAGAGALLSPTLIQPDTRVITIGAWSETMFVRVMFRVMLLGEIVGAFVMFLILFND